MKNMTGQDSVSYLKATSSKRMFSNENDVDEPRNREFLKKIINSMEEFKDFKKDIQK